MRIEMGVASVKFYQELTNVAHQFKKLAANHEYKIKDLFKSYNGYILLFTVGLAIPIDDILRNGSSPLMLVCLGVLAVAVIGMLFVRKSLRKYNDNLVDNATSTVFVIDEKGVELIKPHDLGSVRMGWDDIEFARVFKECMCFFEKNSTGIIIAIESFYAEEVIKYMIDHNIDKRVINDNIKKD